MHAVNDSHPNAAKALPTAALALAGAVITALLTIMVVGVAASVVLREYRLAQRLEDSWRGRFKWHHGDTEGTEIVVLHLHALRVRQVAIAGAS